MKDLHFSREHGERHVFALLTQSCRNLLRLFSVLHSCQLNVYHFIQLLLSPQCAFAFASLVIASRERDSEAQSVLIISLDTIVSGQ